MEDFIKKLEKDLEKIDFPVLADKEKLALKSRLMTSLGAKSFVADSNFVLSADRKAILKERVLNRVAATSTGFSLAKWFALTRPVFGGVLVLALVLGGVVYFDRPVVAPETKIGFDSEMGDSQVIISEQPPIISYSNSSATNLYDNVSSYKTLTNSPLFSGVNSEEYTNYVSDKIEEQRAADLIAVVPEEEEEAQQPQAAVIMHTTSLPLDNDTEELIFPADQADEDYDLFADYGDEKLVIFDWSKVPSDLRSCVEGERKNGNKGTADEILAYCRELKAKTEEEQQIYTLPPLPPMEINSLQLNNSLGNYIYKP